MKPAANDLPPTLSTLELATSAATTKAYAQLTNDFNPIHLDAEFAAGTPFGSPIIHGTMALNLVLEAARRSLGPAHECGMLDIRFVNPSPVGEPIRAGGTLTDPERGIYEVFVETASGIRTLQGELTVAGAGRETAP